MFGRVHRGQWRIGELPALLTRLSAQAQHSTLELHGQRERRATLALEEGRVAAALLEPLGGLAALRVLLDWAGGHYTWTRRPAGLPDFAALERQTLHEQLRVASAPQVRVFARTVLPTVSHGVPRAAFEAEARRRLLRAFGPITLPLIEALLLERLGDPERVDTRHAVALLEALRDDLPEDLHPLLEVQGQALLRWLETE